MGILGPSGTGKSSIFNMLIFLKPKDQGNIGLDGTYLDKTKVSNLIRRGSIGIVYQEDVIWEELTVD